MSVRRGEAVGGVVELEADDGFSGDVWEFVVVEDLDLFAASESGGKVNNQSVWHVWLYFHRKKVS